MPPRYFEISGVRNDKPKYHAELLASLERINTYNPPVQTCSTGWSFSGLYKGPTGIAYLFYRLSQWYPDLEFKQQSLHEWAEAYLQVGAISKKLEFDVNHCGVANESIAHLTLSSLLYDDVSLAKKLCSLEQIINDPNSDGSNEWLYGRAGYLYFLRACRSHFDETRPDLSLAITRSIEKTIARILQVPQPWTWHGKQYLGAAHGVIGIVCQVILSDSLAASALEDQVRKLLKTQFSSGNFPSSLPAGQDELVQFCHGGPGFVLAFRSIKEYMPDLDKEIARAIDMAESDIGRRGMLVKDPCLCHGIAGNALAVNSPIQSDLFLAHMTTDDIEQSGWLTDAGKKDGFASLYGGEAGRAWLWAVMDQGMPRTCIGFNDV